MFDSIFLNIVFVAVSVVCGLVVVTASAWQLLSLGDSREISNARHAAKMAEIDSELARLNA